jgi:hypothetical protein
MLYRMIAGSLPFLENYISLPEMMYGPLFPDLLITMSLAPSGSSRINQMNMARLVAQGYPQIKGLVLSSWIQVVSD